MLSDGFGSHQFQPGTRKVAPGVENSMPNVGSVPPGPYRVDPYLPAINTDNFDPAGAIVINTGRFVGVGNAAAVNGGDNAFRIGIAGTGATVLTLCEGKNIRPVGLAVNQMFKDAPDNSFGTDSNTCRFRRGFLAEVPFITSINNAHGTIVAGDLLTGYFGTTTSTSTSIAQARHIGRPVKWLPKKVYTVSVASSALTGLTAAIYPGITPRIISAYASAFVFVATSATGLVWNSTLAMWTAAFSSPVTTVTYEYGQDVEMIGGEAVRLRANSEILTDDTFYRWVEYMPSDRLHYPPAAERHAVTTVGTGSDPVTGSGWETPSTVTADISYRVANYPMSINHPVYIAIQGTIADVNGTVSTFSGATAADWYILPYNSLKDLRGSFIGSFHTVNWRTGVITFSSNITSVTAIRASYSYITSVRDGSVLWGGGAPDLTDGNNVQVNSLPAAGLPAKYNVPDCAGSLRFWVK